MYVTFNHLNPCNVIPALEGVGSLYQKIINLYAVAKKHDLKYIHIPVRVGHNYNNLENWDDKWDQFFNFKKLSNNDEIDIDKLNNMEKHFITEYLSLEIMLKNNDPNVLYLYYHTFSIFYENPEYYFKDIQNDLINAYDEINYNRKLIYNKNKTNIAIHIRVYNNYDNEGDFELYSKEDTSKEYRFCFTAEMYEILINQLKEKYSNCEIHIFSQEKFFDIKYKKLRDIKDLQFHFDDIDVFDTFHHLCKADVFVMGLSTFSIIAAYYNKNTIIYLPPFYKPVLKSWIVYDNKL
jgi:hypothetical protein